MTWWFRVSSDAGEHRAVTFRGQRHPDLPSRTSENLNTDVRRRILFGKAIPDQNI